MEDINIKEIRESTGMNKREFADYMCIPYRTLVEWERGTRNSPDYVKRLIKYYVETKKLAEKTNNI